MMKIPDPLVSRGLPGSHSYDNPQAGTWPYAYDVQGSIRLNGAATIAGFGGKSRPRMKIAVPGKADGAVAGQVEGAAAGAVAGRSFATGGRKSFSGNPKFLMAPRIETDLSLLSKDRLKACQGGRNISAMNSNDPEERRREEFLARAREAEARAAKTTDPMLRESWLKVAQGYHDLARKK
jgi:hypothetical protein